MAPFVVQVVAEGDPMKRGKVVLDPAEQAEGFDDIVWARLHGEQQQTPDQLIYRLQDGDIVDPHSGEDAKTLEVLAANYLAMRGAPLVLRVAAPGDVSKISNANSKNVAPLNETEFGHVVEAAVVEEKGEEEPEQSECVWLFPEGHWVPTALENFTLVVIVVSVIGFILETLPTYRLEDDGEERDGDHPTFFAIESACIAWFTIEYLVRWYSSHNPKRFPFQAMNIVDLIAIIPYYISLGLGGSSASSVAIVRILRLMRVTRLFKFSRHAQGLQDMITCISESRKELVLFFGITAVCTILFASAIFYAEKDEKETGFVSIPVSMWWAIITMTTVGYGDFSPTSVQGRFIGAIAASLGVVLLAIPAGIFISEFMRIHSERKKLETQGVDSAEVTLDKLEFTLEKAAEYLADYRLAKKVEEEANKEHLTRFRSRNGQRKQSTADTGNSNHVSVNSEQPGPMPSFMASDRPPMETASSRHTVTNTRTGIGGFIMDS
eukprot:m.482567 g.482567  ORF g.482567 m.482567 type:complete len:493 (+) comp22586_c0_seq1:415-1893(+)